MYAAILDKKLVLAVEEAALVKKKFKQLNTEKYRCPRCKKRVILIISEQKAAFFKHFVNYNSQEGEKEEHYSAKMLLKSAFTAAGFNARVEISLADGQLRSDVLVSSKLSIEVQCAPLSEKEFNHRHSLYRKIGILDLWIVGKRHYLKRQLNKTQIIFFRRNRYWGNYYLEVDAKNKLLRLKYHILQAPVSNQLYYQKASFKIDEVGIKRFWTFRPIIKKYDFDQKEERAYLWRQIHQKTNLGKKIAAELYQQQLTVDDLSDDLFQKLRKPGAENLVSQFLKQA